MNIVCRHSFLQVSSFIFHCSFCYFRRSCSRYLKCHKVFHTRLFSTASTEITSENWDDIDVDAGFSVDIEAIVGDDVEKIETMKSLILQVSLMKQSGDTNLPTEITADQWRKLLIVPNEEKRRNYLKHLYVKEKWRNLNKLRNATRHEQYMKALEERTNSKEMLTTSSPPKYDLVNVSLFYRILSSALRRVYNYKLSQAMMFGPHIIVDCSYEENMSDFEIKRCAQQLMYMWSSNRYTSYPFNIIYCNFALEGKIMPRLQKILPNLKDPSCFFNFTEKHYLDLFPKEKLVYLTPHATNELGHYEKENIYIVGAFVDERSSVPVSLAKAKENGIRTAKFPLDRYLNWCRGTKSLPVNQVVSIMNDLKDGACWQYAFRHIAPRKQTFSLIDNDLPKEKQKTTKQLIASYLKNQIQNPADVNFNAQNKTLVPNSATCNEN